ncbi:amidase family protein [Sporosarcina sp. 6E9]|uniref:amidase family protein n=1 Tax=Sporosarcina sp. 6E9 TaxID=2819235 RepID=UPI001B3185AA|nr:amidase family protein [Sporosarcina sp. 6E9]
MSRLEKRLELAKKELRRSVIDINAEINDKTELPEGVLFYGIKDTDQIPALFLNRLSAHKRFCWLTTDKAANKGRAIDTDLLNPLTYRVMTGSTSGGPVNILKGITDFAIGTDGGGSVLAPAISCQLPSIMAAGLGLHVKEDKTSTDGIQFMGSIGVIGKSVPLLKQITEIMLARELDTDEDEPITIAIPQKGTVMRPDGQDMHAVIMNYLNRIKLKHVTIKEVDMTGIDERKRAIVTLQTCFEEVDFVLTCEGPVDVYGYGETIPQQFGQAGRELTNDHGKYLIRAANMCKATAVTIPTTDIASALVIVAKNGLSHGAKAIHLAEKFEQVIELPEVWRRYFLA